MTPPARAMTMRDMAVLDEAAVETRGRWKPYPEYRESGLDWLGHVPAHWSVSRLKFAARLETGHTPSRAVPEYWENCTIPWVSLADVGKLRAGAETIEDTAEHISELGLANSAARLLPAGTVVLSRTASVGFSAIITRPMATTQDFVNWICGHDLDSRYLLNCFRAMSQEFKRLTMGSTHQTIYMPDVSRFVVPLPDSREQRAIVAFLYRETARIDALIAKKERLIELLDERRLALICERVFGDPRSDWPAVRLKSTIVDCVNGTWGDEPDGGDDDVLCVRVADFDRRSSRVMATAGTMRAVSSPQRLRLGLRRGDLLLEKSGGGDRQPAGKVVLYNLDAPAVSSNFVARMRVAPGYDARFLCYLHDALYSMKVNTRSIKQNTGIQNLDSAAYLNEAVRVPPLVEQVALADALDRETARIDALVATVRNHIALLREYRSALISAAVTGKIDVRNEVAA